MALKISLEKKHNGILFKSGYIYKFKYKPFENDPQPLCIFINYINGLHPNTGHQWNLFQMINLHYIKRTKRKQFAKLWMIRFEQTNGNPKLTWKLIKQKYPMIELGIRRYKLKPAYYIVNPKKISDDKIEKEIKGTLFKDFSSKILMKKGQLLRKLTGTGRK